MFKFIESPIPKSINTPIIYDGTIRTPHNHRYSSVDQSYSKPDSSLNSSRIQFSKVQKKYQTGEKTQRENKQRAHSQKKLTLTSAIPPNGSFTSSLGQSQNLTLINAKQAYEGFKKNLQLKSTLNKNTPLQKKYKLTATSRGTQQIKFPTSNTTIRIESTQVIGEKENDYQNISPYIQFQKEKSRALIQANNNNYYTSNPQYYCKNEMSQTAHSSPVYKNYTKGLNLESKPLETCQVQESNSKNASQQEIMNFCNEKITKLKEQMNIVVMQNSKKIKELQSLLLQNKQQIQYKDHKIRQLQLNAVLKENSPTKISFTKNSLTFPQQNNDFLITRINDLQKKVQVLSRWSNEQQEKVNSKLDNVNKFMDNFVAVKFHNLKFTLKAFVSKTEQKVISIIDIINRVDDIINTNTLQSYEHILEKTRSFTHTIQKLTQVKLHEKVHFEDMKTTINTAVDSFKHRPTNSTYQNMIESTEINESFWNNLEDVSGQENKMQQESSFTDDSFSYAPGLKNFQISSNNSSSVNEFALGSFPSFSKVSGEINICKQSLHSIRSSLTEQDSMCIRTLQEIAKYRHGPVTVYLDMNGSLRYKGSESYIFDRKGNILKPSRDQVTYCLAKRWISMA